MLTNNSKNKSDLCVFICYIIMMCKPITHSMFVYRNEFETKKSVCIFSRQRKWLWKKMNISCSSGNHLTYILKKRIWIICYRKCLFCVDTHFKSFVILLFDERCLSGCIWIGKIHLSVNLFPGPINVKIYSLKYTKNGISNKKKAKPFFFFKCCI